MAFLSIDNGENKGNCSIPSGCWEHTEKGRQNPRCDRDFIKVFREAAALLTDAFATNTGLSITGWAQWEEWIKWQGLINGLAKYRNVLHYTSFAGRTETYSAFCISVCGSHPARRKTRCELWKPRVLSKLREIKSCSSDPQHVTLFAKTEQPKTWISLEICLYFQMREEFKSPSSACSLPSGLTSSTSHPSTLSCPGKGGNWGCCWPLPLAARGNRQMGRTDYQPIFALEQAAASQQTHSQKQGMRR